jgi:hypothetical protein
VPSQPSHAHRPFVLTLRPFVLTLRPFLLTLRPFLLTLRVRPIGLAGPSPQAVNLFRGVSLNTTFTSPDGEATDFWGFYNGNKTFVQRFMPRKVGAWTYSYHFSDGACAADHPQPPHTSAHTHETTGGRAHSRSTQIGCARCCVVTEPITWGANLHLQRACTVHGVGAAGAPCRIDAGLGFV